MGAEMMICQFDPRGMGDSDRPASGYEMRTVAAELTELLSDLKSGAMLLADRG